LLGGVRSPVLERAFEYWKSVAADVGRRMEQKVRRQSKGASGRDGRVVSVQDKAQLRSCGSERWCGSDLSLFDLEVEQGRRLFLGLRADA
jgi:hypothetical protein